MHLVVKLYEVAIGSDGGRSTKAISNNTLNVFAGLSQHRYDLEPHRNHAVRITNEAHVDVFASDISFAAQLWLAKARALAT